MISRGESSLISMFKCLEKGLLTKPKRDETENKVKKKTRKREGVEQMKSEISKKEWNILSASTDNEKDFESFHSELENNQEM